MEAAAATQLKRAYGELVRLERAVSLVRAMRQQHDARAHFGPPYGPQDRQGRCACGWCREVREAGL